TGGAWRWLPHRTASHSSCPSWVSRCSAIWWTPASTAGWTPAAPTERSSTCRRCEPPSKPRFLPAPGSDGPASIWSMATVRRVIAHNPGPFTGPGTNTWLLGDGRVVLVIDPGPDDDRHLAALQKALGGSAVGVVLVTHSHADHLELAERLARLYDAPVSRYPGVRDGDGGNGGAMTLRGLQTPGPAPAPPAPWVPDGRAPFPRH